MDEKFYTVKEFAYILMVHPSTVRRAIKNGHIAAFRVGFGKKSSLRILKYELERMQAFNLEEIIQNRIKELESNKL